MLFKFNKNIIKKSLINSQTYSKFCTKTPNNNSLQLYYPNNPINRFDRTASNVLRYGIVSYLPSFCNVMDIDEKILKEALYENPFIFYTLQNPSDEIKLFMIQIDWNSVEYMANISDELCDNMIKINPKVVTKIESVPEKLILKAIDIDPKIIPDVINNITSIEILNRIIDKYPKSFIHINNMDIIEKISEQVIFRTIECDSGNIIEILKRIKSPYVLNKIIDKYPTYIKYIIVFMELNCIEEKQIMKSIKMDQQIIPKVIQCIKSTENLEILIDEYPETITYIKNPTKNQYRIAIKHNPEYMKYVDNLSFNDIVYQIEKNYQCINYLPKLNDYVCLAAIKQNYLAYQIIIDKDEYYKDNMEFLESAFNANPEIINNKHINSFVKLSFVEKLINKNNMDIVCKYINENIPDMQHFIKRDEQHLLLFQSICSKILTMNGLAIKYLQHCFDINHNNHTDVIIKLLNIAINNTIDAYKFVDLRYFSNDNELMKKILSYDGLQIQYVEREKQTDTLCMIALQNTPRALIYIQNNNIINQMVNKSNDQIKTLAKNYLKTL